MVLVFSFSYLFVDMITFHDFQVKRLVKELKSEFVSNLKNVRWMAEKTKRKAREKVHFMILC